MKKGPPKFHPSSPYSMPLQSVFHKNKAMHNFCKRGQHSIVEHNIGVEYALTVYNFQSSLSILISSIHSVIFHRQVRVYFSSEFELIFLSNLYSPQWLRKFSNWCCSHYWKIYLWVKKIESRQFTHDPQAKLSPRFFSLPSREREVTCFPRQHFFENDFPKQKAGRKLLVVHKSNQLELWLDFFKNTFKKGNF